MGNAATFWQSQLYVHVCQLYDTVYATIIIIVKWSVKIFQKNKGLDLHVLSPTKNTVNSLYTCTAEEINGTKLLVTFFLSLFLFFFGFCSFFYFSWYCNCVELHFTCIFESGDIQMSATLLLMSIYNTFFIFFPCTHPHPL